METKEKYGLYIIVLVIVLVIVLIFFKRRSSSPIKTTTIFSSSPPNYVVGRYIMISKSSGYLEVESLTAYDVNGNTLIPSQTTSSITVTDDETSSTEPIFITGSSDKGTVDSRYLLIDYGSNVNIGSITLELRKDCCRNMMVGANIKILDNNSNIIFTAFPLPQIGAENITTTEENPIYVDKDSYKMYKTYKIILPNQLPIGKN